MLICLTGPMAAGKNVAQDILCSFGFVAMDCDKTAHLVLCLPRIKKKIVEAFSPVAQEKGLILEDSFGNLNKETLAKIVFSNASLLETHEKIVHPAINDMCVKFIDENKEKDIVLNAAVLYKVPIMKQCQKIIYIDAPKIVRFFRVKKRDGMKTKQIIQRFKAQNQLFAKYKEQNSDIVRVMNVGSVFLLEKKLKKTLSMHS